MANKTAETAPDGTVYEVEERSSGSFIVTLPGGERHEVSGPPGGTNTDAAKWLHANLPPPRDPTFAEEFTVGLSDAPIAALQMGARIPGAQRAGEAAIRAVTPKAAAAAPERQVTGRIPSKPVEGLSVGRALGNIPGAAAGLGAARLPFLAGRPVLQTLAAGGLGGALQPVEPDQAFWPTKAEQTAMGLTLGYVFHLGGKAVSAGIDKLGKYLMRNYPATVDSYAVRAVLEAIAKGEKAGGLSAQRMLELIEAAQARGQPMTLSDINQATMSRLAGRVYRHGGESLAEQLWRGRDPEALGEVTDEMIGPIKRLMEEIDVRMSGGPSVFNAMRMLLDARSAAAKPAYELTDKLQFIDSPRLRQFLADKDVQQGLNHGFAIERRNALAEGRPFDPTMMGIDLDIDGNIKIIRTPNMRVLDMGKQGLDAMIAKHRNEITGRLDADGVSLDRVRRAYVAELDALDRSGAYRRAREAWGGYSASLDALKAGQAVFNNSPAENAFLFNELGENEKEFFRMGVADKLRERLFSSGMTADEAKKLLGTRWSRMQMRPAFKSDEDYKKFIETVATERAMFDAMSRIRAGSQTAERQAADEAGRMMPESIGIGADVFRAAHGDPMAAVKLWPRISRFLKDFDISTNTEKLNEAIAKIIFSPLSPENQAARSILRTDLPAGTDVPLAGMVRGAVPAVAAGIGGEMAGRPPFEMPETSEDTMRFDGQGNRLQ